MNNKKLLKLSAALVVASAVLVGPAAMADAALDKAMDRAVEHYKRSKAGGMNPGKGDMMKGGQMGDAMKAPGKGDMMKGADAMKAPGKGDMMKK